MMPAGAPSGQVESCGLPRNLGKPRPLSIMIHGFDRTGAYLEKSLGIESNLGARTTCNLKILDVARVFAIVVGHVVEIRANMDRIFAGYVESLSKVIPGNHGEMIYSLTCADYNQIADKRKVVDDFDNMTAGDIVRFLATKYLAGDGVTSFGVQDGPVVTRARFPNFEYVAQAFDELCQQVGFSWFIDSDKDLKFFDRLTYSAPWAITPSSRPYISFEIREERGQYRNRQYLRGGVDTSETLIEKTFVLTEDNKDGPWDVDFPIGDAPLVFANGGGESVAILDKAKADFYWQKGSPTITKDKDFVLVASDVLLIQYHGQVPLIVIQEDRAEVKARQAIEGGTGLWEAVEDDEKIDSLALGLERTGGLLRQFARIPTMATIVTDLSGIRAGMLQAIQETELGVNGNFLVQSATIQDLGLDRLRYSYEVIDGEATADWVQFWKDVAASQRLFVLNENEVLHTVPLSTDFVQASDTLSDVEDVNSLADWRTDPFYMISGIGLSGYSRSGVPTFSGL